MTTHYASKSQCFAVKHDQGNCTFCSRNLKHCWLRTSTNSDSKSWSLYQAPPVTDLSGSTLNNMYTFFLDACHKVSIVIVIELARVCVCARVCVRACVCACIHACVFMVFALLCVCNLCIVYVWCLCVVCVYVYVHAYVCVFVHVWVFMWLRVHACMRACMHACGVWWFPSWESTFLEHFFRFSKSSYTFKKFTYAGRWRM